MNIKMNMILSKLDFVDNLNVPASGADESLCMGACYFIDTKNAKPRKAKKEGGASDAVKLDFDARPVEFFNLMITPEFRLRRMKETTNMQAAMEGAGCKDGYSNYPNLSPFSEKEIVTFIGLLIANGLYPSPQLDFLFKLQSED